MGNQDDVETLSAFLFHPNVQQHKRMLLQHTDKVMRTPMHIAGYKSSEDVVQLLAQAGASVDAEDISGNNPMHLAERGARRKSRELMETYSKVSNGRRKSASREISTE